MQRVLIVLLAMILSARAAAPPHGGDRLRELVVFPELNLNFSFGLDCVENFWSPRRYIDAPAEIQRLQQELTLHPDAPETLLRLADLLADEGDTNESVTCHQKAAQLGQARARANPGDAANLILLGTALNALDKYAEAEQSYRRATQVSPADWRCWVNLGNFLAQKYTVTLFHVNIRNLAFLTGQPPPAAVLDYRPSPEALAQSEAQCREAARCYDRALALAPTEPEVFVQCAGYNSVSNWQSCLFQYFRDHKTIAATGWVLAFFPEASIDNLKHAADLSPDNGDYISLAADFEWSRALLSKQIAPSIESGQVDLAAWPELTRKSIQEALTRLENLSENPNRQLAASALENRGCLDMVFGNDPAAVVDFRRAVTLDPSREQAWDMLLGTQLKTASPEEVTTLCETRLKQKASARNYLFLARALQHQQKWGQAVEQTEAALKLEPDNLTAHLEFAALDLEQSGDPHFLEAAAAQFPIIYKIACQSRGRAEILAAWRILNLNAAVCNGLAGNPADARKCLQVVLKYFPDDPDAKKISDALN